MSIEIDKINSTITVLFPLTTAMGRIRVKRRRFLMNMANL